MRRYQQIYPIAFIALKKNSGGGNDGGGSGWLGGGGWGVQGQGDCCMDKNINSMQFGGGNNAKIVHWLFQINQVKKSKNYENKKIIKKIITQKVFVLENFSLHHWKEKYQKYLWHEFQLNAAINKRGKHWFCLMRRFWQIQPSVVRP